MNNKTENKKVSDLIPDNQNINAHSQRGRGIVEHSIRRYGIGRGIVAAGKGTDTPQIIGGHLTTEIVGSLDMEDVIFVHTTGDKLVVTVRDDIAPNSAEAIALGIIDNESQKQSYNPDLDILAAVMADPAMQALKDEDKMLADIVEGMLNNPHILSEEEAFGGLPDQDRAPFQQMTFTLHDEQSDTVREAIKLSKSMGAFTDSPNENSNGNALARICETFITEHGNS